MPIFLQRFNWSIIFGPISMAIVYSNNNCLFLAILVIIIIKITIIILIISLQPSLSPSEFFYDICTDNLAKIKSNVQNGEIQIGKLEMMFCKYLCTSLLG